MPLKPRPKLKRAAILLASTLAGASAGAYGVHKLIKNEEAGLRHERPSRCLHIQKYGDSFSRRAEKGIYYMGGSAAGGGTGLLAVDALLRRRRKLKQK